MNEDPVDGRRLTRGEFLAAGAVAALARPTAWAGARRTSKVPVEAECVEHVVILMQENVSFDHYLGTLRGVRGFSDPAAISLPNGRSVYQQPYALASQGYLTPWPFDPAVSDPCYAIVDNRWVSRHAAWAGGRMDGFLPATDDAEVAMSYYTRDTLPWHTALADAFTVCDAYHCSVLGPTNPNRLYLWSGTIDPEGTRGGPVIDDSESTPYTWTTYPERLQQNGISWRVYQELDNFDDNALAWFRAYQQAQPGTPLFENGMRRRPAGAFEDDVYADRLPEVSWIIAPAVSSEHPVASAPALGADYCNRIMLALSANPKVWAKTVLILTYDEDGGYFDHVPPPTPAPGTPGEFVNGQPIGPGFRVPTVICSPWTRGGFVSSVTYDHTSITRFLERRFGVMEPNISGWRRQTCGDLWECFNFAEPDFSFPALPATAAGASVAAQACGHYPAARAPSRNGPVPAQEPGIRPRRPCQTTRGPIAIRLPKVSRGQRSGTLTVSQRRTRKLTQAELRSGVVVLEGLPTESVVKVQISIRVKLRGHVRTFHVNHTLPATCTNAS